VRSDDELVEDVRRLLIQDGQLAEHPIHVEANRGIITLAGSVLSYRRKQLAGRIAASVHGCRTVINNLEVRPTGTVADAEIVEHVRAALRAHADITKAAITVNTSMGTVTLHGTVGSAWERAIAEDVALSCRGVRRVSNNLIIDPVIKVEDGAIAREITTALSHTAGLQNAQVRVAVSGGTVVLSGEVEELWQRERAEEVAERYRLISVRNDIEVR
jgi:osmotically-inducible protein OsmY